MRNLTFGKTIIIGSGSLNYMKNVEYKSAFIVTGGGSMIRSGVIDRIKEYMHHDNCDITVYTGIGKNPTINEVIDGLKVMNDVQPDLVVAVGGGSAMDAAKGMVLFYEFPYLTFENVLEQAIPEERTKCKLVCIPSTSGTGTEVTKGTVLTDPEKELKVPIMRPCLRPDIAILDADITMSMPSNIVAETGMDALTHAIESFINKNMDDFDEAFAISAIKGIMEWLPISCKDATIEAREKMHNYQAMAGISFANVGLGMVHGIAHSYGAIFNLAHGVANAIILPYALDFNKRDQSVAKKLNDLSYYCKCDDIIKAIKEMSKNIGIPKSFKELGITEKQFNDNFNLLLEHSMLGATKVNPVVITKETMSKIIKNVYYGEAIEFDV